MSADLTSIVSESHLADTFAVHEFFIGSAVGATAAIGGRLGAGWANGAGTADSAKTCQTLALMGVDVVFFIGTTFSSADAIRVSVETCGAVTVGGLGIVG